jgi:hypothetical protein
MKPKYRLVQNPGNFGSPVSARISKSMMVVVLTGKEGANCVASGNIKK